MLSNSSCNMFSLPVINPRCSSDAVPINKVTETDHPSSFWLSDVYESANRYFDIDELNILQSGTENNEVTIIHVDAVSIFFVSEARLSNDKNLLKTQLPKIELDGYHSPVFL